MRFASLIDLSDELEHACELVRVTSSVDPRHELQRIAELFAEHNGPALLFTNPGDSLPPILANLWCAEKRLMTALGTDSPAEIAARMVPVVQSIQAESLRRLQGDRTTRREAFAYEPIHVRAASVQQVVHLGKDVDLAHWFACSPAEHANSNQFAGLFVHKRRTTGERIFSWQPLRINGRQDFLVACHSEQPLWHELLRHQENDIPLPVALVLGGDAPISLAAAWPDEGRRDGYWLAAGIAGRPVETTRARTCDLLVPASAELIVEGHLYLEKPGDEHASPLSNSHTFGSHQGGSFQSSLVARFKVLAVTHRTGPILPLIVPRDKGDELACLTDFAVQLCVPSLRQQIPALHDLAAPLGAIRFPMLVASVPDDLPPRPLQIAHALWGLPAFCSVRQIVVVDQDVPVRNQAAVMQAMVRNVRPDTDVKKVPGVAHSWDRADPTKNVQHLLIDATRKDSRPLSDGRKAHPAEQSAAEFSAQLVQGKELTSGLLEGRLDQLGLTRYLSGSK